MEYTEKINQADYTNHKKLQAVVIDETGKEFIGNSYKVPKEVRNLRKKKAELNKTRS